MNVLRWLWNAHHYWPVGLLAVFGLFLLREAWALASGRPQDTLSDYAWQQLGVIRGQTLSTGGAGWYLSLGIAVVLFSWLVFHIWFRRYT